MRGVVGTTSSREAGLGAWAQLLPAGPGLDHQEDEPAWLVSCAWCGRYRVGGAWTALVRVPPGGRVSHGICPSCFASVGGRLSRT